MVCAHRSSESEGPRGKHCLCVAAPYSVKNAKTRSFLILQVLTAVAERAAPFDHFGTPTRSTRYSFDTADIFDKRCIIPKWVFTAALFAPGATRITSSQRPRNCNKGHNLVDDNCMTIRCS